MPSSAQPCDFPAAFVRPWKELLESRQAEQQTDFPNHHVANLESLITTSLPRSLYVGTGYSIFTRALLPAVLTAKHSVHFVTCYWAASPSLDALRDTLLQLASSRAPVQPSTPPLRVTIGFSSRGLFQKLFHTSSRDGYTYPPSRWAELGLPDAAALTSGGIELTVKSIFFTPLSVMHPKFVIVDGIRAFVPSCNVSWERWFEGCIELEGDVVSRLTTFHERVWGAPRSNTQEGTRQISGGIDANGDEDERNSVTSSTAIVTTQDGSASQSTKLHVHSPVPTMFLPSSHHRNPRFSFFPFLSHSNPPMTPLNAALLTLFANARRKITILTPNVTSWPALEALLAALARGVDVQIRTSKGMMLIEQLVTAGTTTSWCLSSFIKRYQQLHVAKGPSDVEAQPVAPGKLEILYYKPLANRKDKDDEPTVSHFKMTMVDNEYLVLGSGNMDRASWWTSQEIGVLFYMPSFSFELWDTVLRWRSEVLFRSQ
ncbi:MmgE/PrpD family protein [Purpureocillium lavendulum]|uniref:MmgE/PrpD family protein n=1 Tax=Purpureocillium lavendulum TaxID=1247861 RepID=A0AB34FTA0_9HYPO|nr:MmgE/PrpD family protein [Purpureocillium lavendulum]